MIATINGVSFAKLIRRYDRIIIKLLTPSLLLNRKIFMVMYFFTFSIQVVINPLSWQTDIVAIAALSVFIFAILLLILFTFCWCSKSHHRHMQRLQRRNSIRQSLRSLNTIDPQGSLRRRNYVSVIFSQFPF